MVAWSFFFVFETREDTESTNPMMRLFGFVLLFTLLGIANAFSVERYAANFTVNGGLSGLIAVDYRTLKRWFLAYFLLIEL